MNLSRFWSRWATAVIVALRVGALELVAHLIAVAFEYSMDVLALLGIQYGPRVAR